MGKVTIPASIEEAQTKLAGLGALLTAKEWERAAIVYAFTRDASGEYHGNQHELRSTSTTELTPREFAALGIAGLKSDTTVRDYRRAWQTAIDDGQAKAVEPGDIVELPTRDWPPNPKAHTPTASESVAGFRALLQKDPAAAVHEVIRGEPAAMAKLSEGVASHPALREMVTRDRDREVTRDAIPTSRVEPDYSQELRYAVNAFLRVLSAMRDGKWAPDEMETTLLTFLRQAFAEIANDESTYSVIDEIEAFLVTSR